MSNASSSESGLPSLSKIFDKSNETSIRLIADAMPQIVWIAGADGTIEYFNLVWIEFTGRTLEQSLGSGWQSVLHPDDVEKCSRLWLDAVEAGTPLETECRFRRASDGVYRWHLARAHALKNETGAIIKWVGSSTDIDDQKAAQQALRASVENVEQQVRERTAELLTTNMQLLDAISERRQAAVSHEQDTERLNGIIATQALLAQAELNLPTFLDLASRKIQKLTNATGAVVELVDGDELVYAAAAGKTAEFKGLRLKMSGSLSGLCIRKRQVLKCDNSNEDPRVDKQACLKVGAVTLVVAPLYNQGTAIGVLKILSDTASAFGQRDVQTLELMAGLLGAAIAQQVHMQSNGRLFTERTDDPTVNFFIGNKSAHERLETTLARKAKIFRAIADDLPAWIAYIDAQERYRFANAHYIIGSGLNPADLIGRTVSEVVGESRYAAMKDEIGKAMHGTEVRYERMVDKPEGVIRQKVHYIPDTDEHGAVIGFYSIVSKVEEGRKEKSAPA